MNRWCTIGAATLLAACSKPDPCGELTALGTAAETNGAACAVDGGIAFVPEGSMTQSVFRIGAYLALAATTDAGVCGALFDTGPCNAADAAALSGAAASQQSCFASAPGCTAGGGQAWMSNLLLCLGKAEGCCTAANLSVNSQLSGGCVSALLDAGVL